MLLFVSSPARAPETAVQVAAQGRAAPKRPRRKLAKKSSTFLDKSSLKRRNLRGKAIPWVEAFRFETREDYEDSAVYKDKISTMKTRDKGGRPYKVFYCVYSRKTGYTPCPYALRVTHTLEGEVVVEEISVEHAGSSHNDHSRSENERKTVDYSKADKRIKELLEVDCRTRNIIADLRLKELIHPSPTKHQISAKIQRIRDKLKLSAKKITVEELKTFITDKKKIPEDPSTPFIVLDFVETNPEVRFGFLISSKKLIDQHLRNQQGRWTLAVDFTYKVIIITFSPLYYVFSSFFGPKMYVFAPKIYVFAQKCTFMAQILTFLAQIFIFCIIYGLIFILGFHRGREAVDGGNPVREEVRPGRHRCVLPRNGGRVPDGLRVDRQQRHRFSDQPDGRRRRRDAQRSVDSLAQRCSSHVQLAPEESQ